MERPEQNHPVIGIVYYCAYLVVIYIIAGFRVRNLAVSAGYWLLAFVTAMVVGLSLRIFLEGIPSMIAFGSVITACVVAYIFRTIAHLKNEKERPILDN